MNWTKSEVERIDHLLRTGSFSEAITQFLSESERSEDSIRYMMKRRAYVSKQVSFLDKKVEDFGKVVGLFDLHYGKDENGNNIHLPLEPMFTFLSDYKPDVLVLGGDNLDMACISHWLKQNLLRQRDLPLPKDYYNDYNRDVSRPLRQVAGPKCKIIFLGGNHDWAWVERYIEENPNAEGFVNLDKNIEEVDEFIPYQMDRFYKIGRLFYHHGFRRNKYHAALTAIESLRAVRYGHLHTLQAYTQSSNIDIEDYHIAISCPCWCNRAEGYARNRPNAHVNGFQVGYVEKDGSFEDYIVVINKNWFRAEGKNYKV